MAEYILLTGAGFSRSWDAWLGFEVFSYLLGCTNLSPAVRALLWECEQSGQGFEAALSTLQIDGPTHEAEALGEAVTGMFRVMGEHLGTNISFNAKRFLQCFDTVFTLNQDVLLERKCHDLVHVPGVIPSARSGYLVPSDDMSMSVPEGKIAYLKLHGSIDFIEEDTSTGHPVLIVGGSKTAALEQYPLLSAFFSEFRRQIGRPDTRIVVSGYSFRDPHVNEVIAEAAATSGLKLFINDLAGLQPLEKAPLLNSGERLIEALRSAIIAVPLDQSVLSVGEIG